MKPRGRGHSIYEAEAKAGCNEAKAKSEAVISGLEAEAISRTQHPWVYLQVTLCDPHLSA